MEEKKLYTIKVTHKYHHVLLELFDKPHFGMLYCYITKQKTQYKKAFFNNFRNKSKNAYYLKFYNYTKVY